MSCHEPCHVHEQAHVFMGTMSELRGGLSEEQKRHAEAVRAQLQHDLAEQVGPIALLC